MDITQSSSTTPPLFASGDAGNQTTSKAALSSDFETFLRMLTVQMENQDPLNPIDSADYAVQLATFSSVEQQVLTNDLLTALTKSLNGGNLATLGQWVGMDVRGTDTARFDGTSVDLATPNIEDADRRLLVINDPTGTAVARIDLDLISPEFQWDGQLTNGSTAKLETYSYAIEGYKDGQLIETLPATTYARVQEAKIENGTTLLMLEGGVSVASQDVTGVRQPKPGSPDNLNH